MLESNKEEEEEPSPAGLKLRGLWGVRVGFSGEALGLRFGAWGWCLGFEVEV